ncbi:TonB C-terminal domain-containing protein [Roseateles chitinivorans]|uniref:TonB C-terminal domain-containing protein n=1 Tax=Roseateles chitinivorans TaxID=2917965 RepID=UPI003D66AE28
MKLLFALIASVTAVGLCSAQGVSTPQDARQRPPSFSDVSIPYAKRLGDAIRFYLLDPGPVSPDSFSEVEINVKASGEITSYKLIRSGGSPQWEAAVIRAMAKADRIPLDVDGKVPASVILMFRP